MSRPGWAKGKELELLQSLQPEYDVAKVKKDYKDFWPKLFNTFVTQFPLIDQLFPGKVLDDLTPEESEIYSAGLKKLHQVSSTR